jgi:hypothetical protein
MASGFPIRQVAVGKAGVVPVHDRGDSKSC